MTPAATPCPPLAFRSWAVTGSFMVQALAFGAIYSFPAFLFPAFALAGTLLLARALRSAGTPRREAERLSPVCPSP